MDGATDGQMDEEQFYIPIVQLCFGRGENYSSCLFTKFHVRLMGGGYGIAKFGG